MYGKGKKMEKKRMNYAEFKEALKDALQTRFLGRAEVYFQSVKKTNDTAKEAVVLWKKQKEPCPTNCIKDTSRQEVLKNM